MGINSDNSEVSKLHTQSDEGSDQDKNSKMIISNTAGGSAALIDQLKGIRQMLWINKIIKSPTINTSCLENQEGEYSSIFTSLIVDIICTLSQEFSSHRHEMRVSLVRCAHGGPTHKRVSYSSI